MEFSKSEKVELELYVYKIAREFWKNYEGGYWEFSKENRFWYPCVHSVHIFNPYNDFEGILSCKSAGIAFSILACFELSMKYFEKDLPASKSWNDLCHHLRELAYRSFSEKEKVKIFAFLK